MKRANDKVFSHFESLKRFVSGCVCGREKEKMDFLQKMKLNAKLRKARNYFLFIILKSGKLMQIY